MRRTQLSELQAATSETARGINRGIVLNLIRRRQPISRADLARASGLQRSTVSLITEQLIRERWVVYGSMGRLPRGRRPMYLQLNDKRGIFAVDLRPMVSIVAVSDVNGRLLSEERILTPAHPDNAAELFAASVRKLKSRYSDLVFEGIGISVPGRFDKERQRVVFAPNLKWPEFDLKKPLEQATDLEVEMENAANACALAEVWFGASEKSENLMAITVAEGVGVGVVCDGRLLRGGRSMAGEFGHICLDPAGPPCGCGSRGCWEVYASNWAALRYYRESGGSENITFQDLLSLAEKRDELALSALVKMSNAVGRGIRTLIAGLAPEEIVIAGECTRLWSVMGPIIAKAAKESVLAGEPPKVRAAAAEPSTARLRGTVALVLQKRFGLAASEKRPRGFRKRKAAEAKSMGVS